MDISFSYPGDPFYTSTPAMMTKLVETAMQISEVTDDHDTINAALTWLEALEALPGYVPYIPHDVGLEVLMRSTMVSWLDGWNNHPYRPEDDVRSLLDLFSEDRDVRGRIVLDLLAGGVYLEPNTKLFESLRRAMLATPVNEVIRRFNEAFVR